MDSVRKFGVAPGDVAQVGATYAALAPEIGGQAIPLSGSRVGRETVGEPFAAQGNRYKELTESLARAVQAFGDHADGIGDALQQTARKYSGTETGNAQSFQGR